MSGVVAPDAMNALEVTATFPGSLLTSVMETPPAGAGAAREMGQAIDCADPTVLLAGAKSLGIPDAVTTVTAALTEAIAVAVAVTVEKPAATGVTETLALVALAAKVTVPGTMAADGLLEESETESPLEGAGAFSVSVRN